ncbi:Nascent polypeptide-associated complex subunit beta [Kappamyces sp. JEL0829]|nr:Nascent polypeptide-associated complex subunit beta [Kappamyces sp. JEL0829]KAJ3356442.1 Nascent polypeptide-associated complex subunit beta [Kappamyces sp. JEL0680]
MNAAKLAKLQEQVRIGGKGTPRRKVKKVQKVIVSDEKKLEEALKKLNVQPITSVEEVNMFKADGKILHFTRPTVEASVASNTFVIKGVGFNKDLTQLLPGILTQLGPEALDQLRIMAQQFQAQQAAAAGAAGADDDDIPDLVENAGEGEDGPPELVEA